jgi:16S rRNA (uracil1498-N3)-methyltransferase
MPRFFYPLDLTIGATIDLPQNIVHHCHVLRFKAGDTIMLFNGRGGCYAASLSSLEKKHASAQVKFFDPSERELHYVLTLAQALPEAGKMDWIIEKAVELGVTTVQPLTAQRCVTRLSDERAEKRRIHWQGVITAASEQCGRNRLTQLSELNGFTTWIAQQNLHRRILLSPHADMPLTSWLRHHPAQSLTLIIGPEGGLTEQEHQLALQHGAIPLSMGPRILRTETAGLCAISMVNAHCG